MDNNSKKDNEVGKKLFRLLKGTAGCTESLLFNNRVYQEMIHRIFRPATNFSLDVLMY
jgi:hypothetical protein